MRKDAREIAFKMIYQSLYTNDNAEELLEFLCEEAKVTDKDKQFIGEVVKFYSENKEQIQKKVEDNLIGFEKGRVYKIDLALMYEAITEILFVKTPVAIVINEVLDLAKEYSTEKSAGYINGVVGKVTKLTE